MKIGKTQKRVIRISRSSFCGVDLLVCVEREWYLVVSTGCWGVKEPRFFP